jgi:hypothetical protein
VDNSNNSEGAGNPGGFLYVLQPDAVGDEALAGAAFKWLVLEPGREGNVASEFSRGELRSATARVAVARRFWRI